ncbi:UPF0175 family protein [Oscillatoria sp. FACHB-1406]|nr:UPF0175 family protein [Oscillatoria sp. FACHB-1406]
MQYKFDSSSISFSESTSEPSSDFTLPKILLKLANIPDAELKLELALLLFKQEKITLGTASQIAGLNQLEFQRHLGRRQIPIHYGIDDFRQDLKTLETELSE